MSRLFRSLSFAVVAVSVLALQPALSQQPPTTNVRGTVESASDNAVTVKAGDGALKAIELKTDTAITFSNRLTAADIKPNSFIAIVGMTQDDSSNKALSIQIFPEEARGRGEGSRGYSMGLKSTMTNATVAPDTVKSSDGQIITVTYKDGEKKFLIATDTQVWTRTPATKADLKQGVGVVVTAAEKGADKLEAVRISVAKDGFVPL